MDGGNISQRQLLIGVIAISIILLTGAMYWIGGEAGLQAVSIVTTGLLTLALVALYYQQYSVQNKQTDLMKEQQSIRERQTEIMDQQNSIQERQTTLIERGFESEVAKVGQIYVNQGHIYLSLKNSGRGTVQQIYLRSEIVSDTESIGIKPGISQLISVEDKDSSLPAFSPPREFKAKVRFTQIRESGKETFLPFKYFSNRLGHEGLNQCILKLTLEIVDESTRAKNDVIEFEIANQEITIPEVKQRELPSEDDKTKTIATVPKTPLEDAIKLLRPQDILPHDFEERTSL